MIDEFRTFQYCVLFAKEAFRAGIVSREAFTTRLHQLGYTPAEAKAEVQDVLTEEAYQISKIIYL